MSQSVKESLAIIVPSRSKETIPLIKRETDKSKLTSKLVIVDNDEDLTLAVSDHSNCYIIGDLAPNWKSDGPIFEGIGIKSFIWPPTFVISKSLPSERGTSLLLQRGILWCFQEKNIKLNACPEYALLIKNQLWKTEYGCVFQKITGNSIRNGNYLAIILTEIGTYGRIVFNEGNVVAASYNKSYGIEALYELALLQKCRIDLHTLFFNSTPQHMKEPYMTVLNQLLELANSRRQHLSFGRPPGLTETFSSELLSAVREEFAGSGATTVDNRKERSSEEGKTHTKPLNPDDTISFEQNSNHPPKPSDNVNILEVNEMNLNEFISTIPGARGGVVLSFDGACLNAEGEIDSDTVAAVATMSLEHIGRLNELLLLNGVRSCAISGSNSTLFMRFDQDILASYGGLVKNASVICKKI